MNIIMEWVNQYGYIVLFLSLFLELLALPIPTEVLMTYIGYLVFKGEMNQFVAILVAFTGSSLGMTVTYWIGRKVGFSFFEKYGSKFHFGADRLHKTSLRFQKYGKKTIIFAYFVPGLRHLTGYFSGITRLSFKIYILFAYTGAFIWAGSFITVGYLLGPKWEEYKGDLDHYLLFLVISIVIITSIFQLLKRYSDTIRDGSRSLFKSVLLYVPSINRIKVAVALLSTLFIGSFALMIGLIQDYLANEMGKFNQLTEIIIHSMLTDTFIPLFLFIEGFAAHQFLLIVFISGITLILFKRRREEKIEILLGVIVVAGGWLLEEMLPVLFTTINSSTHPEATNNPFPSEAVLISIIVYGWLAYVVAMRINSKWVKTILTSILFLLLLLLGVGKIYLSLQSPGNLVAGYVFGLVWLSLCIGAKEIFHLLSFLELDQ